MTPSSASSLPIKSFPAVSMPTFNFLSPMATTLPSVNMLHEVISNSNVNLISSSASTGPIFSMISPLASTNPTSTSLPVNVAPQRSTVLPQPIRMLPPGSIVLSVNLGDRSSILPDHLGASQPILQSGSTLPLPFLPANQSKPAQIVNITSSSTLLPTQVSTSVSQSRSTINKLGLPDNHLNAPLLPSVMPSLAPAVQSAPQPVQSQLPIMIRPHPQVGSSPSLAHHNTSDNGLQVAGQVSSLYVAVSGQSNVSEVPSRPLMVQDAGLPQMSSLQLSQVMQDNLYRDTQPPSQISLTQLQTANAISTQSPVNLPQSSISSYLSPCSVSQLFSNSHGPLIDGIYSRGQSSLTSSTFTTSSISDEALSINSLTSQNAAMYTASTVTSTTSSVGSSASYSSQMLSKPNNLNDYQVISIETVTPSDHVMNTQNTASRMTSPQTVVTSGGGVPLVASPSTELLTSEKEFHNSIQASVNLATDEQDNQNLAIAPLSVIEMLLKNQVDGEIDITNTTESGQKETTSYCVDCNESYLSGCPQHDCGYMHILDVPILSRARMTLPLSLTLKTVCSNESDVPITTGVWTKEQINYKSRFGPLEGRKIDELDVAKLGDTTGMWQIFRGDQCSHLLDSRDENEANWMIFVRKARSSAEQNLTAYQDGDRVYFVTCRDIDPGKELLYWYSKGYAKLLGVSTKAEDSFRCTVCNKQFANVKSLNQHVKYQHPDMSARKFKCHLCSRGFHSAGKLQTHMLGHLGVKPHHCHICNKQFTDQSNLRMHLSVHTGEKPFLCHLCHRRFRQKAHLASHMLTHTGEKKLQCSHCNKMFARPSDLKTHEYQHTKERVFICSYPSCGKTFYKQQIYKKHLNIHSGIRNFKCDRCTKMFSSKYHLDRHKRTCKGVIGKKQDGAKMDAMVDGATVSVQTKRRIQKRRQKQNQNDSVGLET